MNENNVLAHQLFKSMNKNKTKLMNKNKIFAELEGRRHDVVEQKNILLKNIKNNIENIEKETIKEFVYSNKTIPSLWKKQKNFKNIVLETFIEDDNFLQYLGNAYENNDSIPVKNKTLIRPKTVSTERSNLKHNFQTKTKNDYNNKKRKNVLLDKPESMKSFSKSNNTTNIRSMSYSKSVNHPKIKLRKILSPQEEIQNIFNNLKEEYPLIKKLEELYPNYNWDKINRNMLKTKKDEKNENDQINTTENNNDIDNFNYNSVEDLIDKSKLHKINKMERNIFNNLLSINKTNKKLKCHKCFKSNKKLHITNSKMQKGFSFNNIKSNKKRDMMKHELNDSTIFNHLNSMNFYGPYFSYCPYCFGNNIKYYKYMEKRQCVSLLNFIKMDRNKKMLEEESKFRKNIKMDKNVFSYY
jgi:hypothetical protein